MRPISGLVVIGCGRVQEVSAQAWAIFLTLGAAGHLLKSNSQMLPCMSPPYAELVVLSVENVSTQTLILPRPLGDVVLGGVVVATVVRIVPFIASRTYRYPPPSPVVPPPPPGMLLYPEVTSTTHLAFGSAPTFVTIGLP